MAQISILALAPYRRKKVAFSSFFFTIMLLSFPRSVLSLLQVEPPKTASRLNTTDYNGFRRLQNPGGDRANFFCFLVFSPYSKLESSIPTYLHFLPLTLLTVAPWHETPNLTRQRLPQRTKRRGGVVRIGDPDPMDGGGLLLALPKRAKGHEATKPPRRDPAPVLAVGT